MMGLAPSAAQEAARQAAEAAYEGELAAMLLDYLGRHAPSAAFEDRAAASLYAARLKIIQRELECRVRFGLTAAEDGALAALQVDQTARLRDVLTTLALPGDNLLWELLETATAVGEVVLRALPAASDARQ